MRIIFAKNHRPDEVCVRFFCKVVWRDGGTGRDFFIIGFLVIVLVVDFVTGAFFALVIGVLGVGILFVFGVAMCVKEIETKTTSDDSCL